MEVDVMERPVARAKQPKGRKDEAVRIDTDVLDDIRAVVGFTKQSITEYISQNLRPIAQRDLLKFAQRAIERKGKSE